mgnify:CR=1 FL=1
MTAAAGPCNQDCPSLAQPLELPQDVPQEGAVDVSGLPDLAAILAILFIVYGATLLPRMGQALDRRRARRLARRTDGRADPTPESDPDAPQQGE